MTIAVAWTRTVSNCEELIFVTDSRLSGDGRTFDACPKTMTLPRTDCAIAFAGFTGHAYPMMQQLSFAIDAHAPLQRGSLEITQVKSHALKIFGAMASQIRSSDRLSSPVNTDPEAEFLFGGYSWIKKKFELWNLRYSRGDKKFRADPAGWIYYLPSLKKFVVRGSGRGTGARLGMIAFAGDQGSTAKGLLMEKLRTAATPATFLDWQPLEVVRDMLRDHSRSETIGGAPQVVKVYQYMKSASIAVNWPDLATGSPHLQGRPLLGYERTEKFVIDPDTLTTTAHVPIKR